MIICFSGTGNSLYAAGIIAELCGDSVIDANRKIKNDDHFADVSGEDLVIVSPTYAWRIPRVLSKWIEDTPLKGIKRAWFVLTCGSEIGNAAKYNRLLCEKKGFEYMGTAQIIMPENYIAMFNAPDKSEAEIIIRKARHDILKAAERIKSGSTFDLPRNNLYDRTMSFIINPIFYDVFVKAGPFYAEDTCNGCGKCVKLCPLNNIHLENNKPVWGSTCTHCMACICQCPEAAIEFGNKSKGKPRYYCSM